MGELRPGLPVHTPPADTWQDWVEKFGVDPDRVRGTESDDLAWLPEDVSRSAAARLRSGGGTTAPPAGSAA